MEKGVIAQQIKNGYRDFFKNYTKADIIQIVCVTAILLILASVCFNYITSTVTTVEHDGIPVFVGIALLFSVLLLSGLKTYKWLPLLKRKQLRLKSIITSYEFMIVVGIDACILNAVAVYYTYYYYPDFQYDWIFNFTGVLIIMYMVYAIVRLVYTNIKSMEFLEKKG